MSVFPDIHVGPDDGQEDQEKHRLLPEDNSPDDDSEDDIRPTPAYVVGLLGFDPDEFNNAPEPMKAPPNPL